MNGFDGASDLHVFITDSMAWFEKQDQMQSKTKKQIKFIRFSQNSPFEKGLCLKSSGNQGKIEEFKSILRIACE